MNFLGIAISLIFLLSVLALLLYFGFARHQTGASTEQPWAMWSALATIMLAFLTFLTLAYTVYTTSKANERSERLFEVSQKQLKMSERLFAGQNTPLIDVTPLSVGVKNNFTITKFSIANYRGFTARNIGIDLRYGDDKTGAAWISEWLKAQDDKQTREAGQKAVREGVLYPSAPRTWIPELKSGDTVRADSNGQPLSITGSFSLQSICPSAVSRDGFPSKSHPVHIRVTWQNELGHTFDEVHRYALVCTLDRDADRRAGLAMLSRLFLRALYREKTLSPPSRANKKHDTNKEPETRC